MPLCDWEKTITCPYNPSHQITAERIQFHLVKCRKNHPEMDMAVCPYNASHHVPKPEEKFHIARCPDRKIIELAKYSWALDKEHGNLSRPPISHVSRGHSDFMNYDDEDWGRGQTSGASYDPKKKAAEKNVLRKLEGATPSQRSEFRAKERFRLSQIQEKERVAAASTSASTAGSEIKEVSSELTSTKPPNPEVIKPLRRPVLAASFPGNPLLARHLGRSRLVETGDEASTVQSLNTSTDTLDLNLRALSLGRGHYIAGSGLRHPSGRILPYQKIE